MSFFIRIISSAQKILLPIVELSPSELNYRTKSTTLANQEKFLFYSCGIYLTYGLPTKGCFHLFLEGHDFLFTPQENIEL